VLSAPGDYWVTKDLTCGATFSLLPVINVVGSNIRLHLNNHVLRSRREPVPETMPCLIVGGSGNTVQGPGRIGGFGSQCSRGISLNGSHNTIRGVHIQGWDLGLELNPGTANTVEDVTIDGAGYAAVYASIGPNDSLTLRHITVRGTYENGFKNVAGINQLIEYNSLYNTQFAMSIGGTGSTLRGNTVVSAWAIGLSVSGTDLTITGNKFRHSSWDIEDLNPNPCVVNHYSNNTFTRASDPCIQ
jgi:hypothetical protein